MTPRTALPALRVLPELRPPERAPAGHCIAAQRGLTGLAVNYLQGREKDTSLATTPTEPGTFLQPKANGLTAGNTVDIAAPR